MGQVYTFSSIYPQLNNIPNGIQVNIPSFDISPVSNNFSFDDFDDAVFKDGVLTLTIQNNLAIPLGDVNINLLKRANNDQIDGGSINIEGPIISGETKSGNLELKNLSEPLPGNIIVLI